MEGSRRPGALKGIRVVEIGTAIAGPLCAALLGDMGADVVKVEVPGRGDDSRGYGEKVGGESPYFIQYNRNKRSIALDIKKEDGRDVLLKLADRSDVILENFRPGTMRKLSLSYEVLKKRNPGLIYCSVSGFGQTGPYSPLGGYDAIIQAMCGLMSVTGEEGGPPLRVGAPITDVTAALSSAYSIALALFARERTGKGQKIDVSLFESGIMIVSQWITIAALTGKPVGRFGNRYPLVAPYEVFEASDRPFVMAVGNDALFAKLCGMLSLGHLLDDPRFGRNEERIKKANRDALAETLQQEFAKRKAREWVRSLGEAGIPAGQINSVQDLPHDPQLLARGAFPRVKHGSLGYIRLTDPLPKLSATPGALRKAAPTLGENTDELLMELGYAKRVIASLRKDGVVG